MDKVIVANMKNVLTIDEVVKYNNITKINGIDLIICPSLIHLNILNNKNYKIGVQNVSFDKICTGEISLKQLKEYNIEYSIIGHMERRILFNESDFEINNKINICLNNNIKVILCIGNKNQDDSIEEIYKVLNNQLNSALSNINSLDNILVAYEPYFNIGFNTNVDIDKIKVVKEYIHNLLLTKYKVVPTIIYGGNVNKSNIKEIINIYDGIMVGRNSFKYDDFTSLLTILTNC